AVAQAEPHCTLPVMCKLDAAKAQRDFLRGWCDSHTDGIGRKQPDRLGLMKRFGECTIHVSAGHKPCPKISDVGNSKAANAPMQRVVFVQFDFARRCECGEPMRCNCGCAVRKK